MTTTIERPVMHDPKVRAASLALRDLCRAVSDAEAALARGLGLRAVDYRAVKRVLYSGEPVGVTDLAASLGLSKGTTSELIDRLEERDLLRRDRSADDGRRVLVRATPMAVAQVHEGLASMFEALADVARGRDAGTLRAVTGFLTDAVEAVSA